MPLIEPINELLVNLLVAEDEVPGLKEHAGRLPSIQLAERQVWDFECLAVGAFSPLDQFMGREDFERTLEEMRLADGIIYPIPVALSVE